MDNNPEDQVATQLRAIAEDCSKSDPNVAIVLFALLGARHIGMEYRLAVQVREFAKEMRDYCKKEIQILNN